MLPFTSALIMWVVFTNEERAVLIEAINNMFPLPKETPASFDWKPYPESSAGSEPLLDEAMVGSLLSIRRILVESLSDGAQAVVGITERDSEALSALVMQGIAGYYDFQISIEEKMASAGVEYYPIEDDRQKVRLGLMSKLGALTRT